MRANLFSLGHDILQHLFRGEAGDQKDIYFADAGKKTFVQVDREFLFRLMGPFTPKNNLEMVRGLIANINRDAPFLEQLEQSMHLSVEQAPVVVYVPNLETLLHRPSQFAISADVAPHISAWRRDGRTYREVELKQSKA